MFTAFRKSTRWLLSSLAFLIIFPAGCLAQDPDFRFELFGGYARLDERISEERDRKGWEASAAFKPYPFLGLVFDVSQGRTDYSFANVEVRNLHAGPQFSLPARHVSPFARMLLGATRREDTLLLGGPAFGSDSRDWTFMSMVLGGGVDWRVADHFALRVPQLDYIRRFEGQPPLQTGPELPSIIVVDKGDIRLSFGLVVRF